MCGSPMGMLVVGKTDSSIDVASLLDKYAMWHYIVVYYATIKGF